MGILKMDHRQSTRTGRSFADGWAHRGRGPTGRGSAVGRSAATLPHTNAISTQDTAKKFRVLADNGGRKQIRSRKGILISTDDDWGRLT